MHHRIPRLVRTAAIATAWSSLVLAQQACAPSGTADPASSASATPQSSAATAPAGEPVPTPTPSLSGSAGPGVDSGASPILRGERQVVIRPVEAFEAILAVDGKGRLNLTDGDADKGLFVLFPIGNGRYQIKTAKAQSGGEPACMGLRDNGTSSPTIVAAACDVSAKGQLFSIEPTGTKDAQGRPLYAISTAGGHYLRSLDGQGLVAQNGGEAGSRTTFSFVDNGAAQLPQVGD
ncbi:hypothetical protein ACTMSW_09360 [Micromonospora sp. BQ11]|uniref:hypothetical protein n=1 Tax=Micromonospora sp. BQ11 TaxID=3452212 RepID=UPI003F88A605